MNSTYITSLASIPKWRWHLQVGVSLRLNEMTHVQCLTPKMAFWAQLVLMPRKPFACSVLSSLGIPTVQAQNPTHCEHTTLTKLEKWPQSLEDMWMVTTFKFLRLKNRYKEAGKVHSVTSYLFSKYYWLFTPFARRLARPGDLAGTCHYMCSDTNRRTRWHSRQTWVHTLTQQFIDSMILGTLFNPHQFELHQFYNRVYNNSTFTSQGC